ncbi:aminotransferase-like domain-containing protein [Xanthobacter pseudotagetidis]|uniref:aminotransferase-like domain-containing protein n=1 Tax=Xanthobacter pseudotagetidis TaxID=3119911 RepID=UPI00372C4155
MTDWVPSLSSQRGPRYVSIVDQLETDIAAGRVRPGTRLLPQRDMAERLGISVGTVSKAYAEAEQRGLISGEVGRGTFVLRRKPQARTESGGGRPAGINLALNVPPATGEADLIAATLAEIVSDSEIGDLLGYLPHQGRRDHREAIASWLANHGMAADPDRVFITHGAQHALSIALGMVAHPGDPVLTESLTYSGMLALSAQHGYRLHGVTMDAHGLVPDALDAAFRETGARALYCMPTLQTPTGIVMPHDRRLAIADVLRRHDAYLLEDDAYAFLMPVPPQPLSTLVPERAFYAVSLAKCLAPGLRIGAMIAPDAFRDRCINALRATGWMAVPVMAEAAARLIRNGSMERQAMLKREKAARRDDVLRRVLKDWLPPRSGPPCFHVWLPLPMGRTLMAFIAQAAQAGITLAPPGALRPQDPGSLGVRLCLGAPASEADIEAAVTELRAILEMPEAISLV